jgi:hypothetical protein
MKAESGKGECLTPPPHRSSPRLRPDKSAVVETSADVFDYGRIKWRDKPRVRSARGGLQR